MTPFTKKVLETLCATPSAKLALFINHLDLSEAFDRLSQKHLLSILTNFVIRGTAWWWFDSCGKVILDDMEETHLLHADSPCKSQKALLFLDTCSLSQVISLH